MKPFLVLSAVLVLGLSGCASADPQAQLRVRTRDVIAAANSENSAALRAKANDLLGTISKLGATRELDSTQEQQLRQLTLDVLADAGLLDVEPVPSPVPTTASPTPSPSPSPSPTLSPSPSPSPPPPPSPTPSPSPPPPSAAPSPQPSRSPRASVSPSPQVSGAASRPSPSVSASPTGQPA